MPCACFNSFGLLLFIVRHDIFSFSSEYHYCTTLQEPTTCTMTAAFTVYIHVSIAFHCFATQLSAFAQLDMSFSTMFVPLKLPKTMSY